MVHVSKWLQNYSNLPLSLRPNQELDVSTRQKSIEEYHIFTMTFFLDHFIVKTTCFRIFLPQPSYSFLVFGFLNFGGVCFPLELWLHIISFLTKLKNPLLYKYTCSVRVLSQDLGQSESYLILGTGHRQDQVATWSLSTSSPLTPSRIEIFPRSPLFVPDPPTRSIPSQYQRLQELALSICLPMGSNDVVSRRYSLTCGVALSCFLVSL